MSRNTKFRRVAQNFHVHRKAYYAVLKKTGKQIWRSLSLNPLQPPVLFFNGLGYDQG